MAHFVAGFGRIVAGFTGCKSMAYRSNLEQRYQRRRQTATTKGQPVGVTGVTIKGWRAIEWPIHMGKKRVGRKPGSVWGNHSSGAAVTGCL
jgi:hypothetical protein